MFNSNIIVKIDIVQNTNLNAKIETLRQIYS